MKYLCLLFYPDFSMPYCVFNISFLFSQTMKKFLPIQEGFSFFFLQHIQKGIFLILREIWKFFFLSNSHIPGNQQRCELTLAMRTMTIINASTLYRFSIMVYVRQIRAQLTTPKKLLTSVSAKFLWILIIVVRKCHVTRIMNQ